MPTSVITAPDGNEYEVTHPEGASDQEILDYAQKNSQSLSIAPPPAGLPSASTPEGSARLRSGNWQQTQEGLGVAKRYGVTPPQIEEAKVQTSDFLRNTALPAVAPTLGAMLGAAGGALIASPTVAGVPAGALAGEALGSMAGEGFNQATGITQPSAAQVGMAAVAPGVGRGIGGMVGWLKKQFTMALPGAGAAMRDSAAKQAQGLGESVKPTIPSDELYKVVRQHDPTIDLTPVREMAERIGQEQAPRAAFGVDVPGGVAGVIEKTRRTLAPKDVLGEVLGESAESPTMRFQDVWTAMKGFNDKIGSLKAQGGEGLGEMLQMKKAFAQSLEKATEQGAGPAYQSLKEANRAFRQEIAADTVTDILRKNFNPLEGRETYNLSAGKAIKALREATIKDPFLADSFPPGALDRITGALDAIRRLPVVGAPPGADAGSKRQWPIAAVGGALGAIINAATGSAIPSAVAIPVGGLAAFGAAELISKALMTEGGTRMLMRVATEPGVGLTRQGLALLATGLRAETASTKTPPPERPVVRGTPTSPYGSIFWSP